MAGKPSKIPDRFPTSDMLPSEIIEAGINRDILTIWGRPDKPYLAGQSPDQAEVERLMPYPLDAAVPGVTAFPYEGNWGTSGFVPLRKADPKNPERIYVNTSRKGVPGKLKPSSPRGTAQTAIHEMDHLLERRSGVKDKVNTTFAQLYPQQARDQAALQRSIHRLGPIMEKKFGHIPNAYFKRTDGGDEVYPDEFTEMFASMSAAEQLSGKRLRDDPEIIKAMGGYDPAFWDAYDAVTGLRQTRLDSKDLPPYTLNRSKRDEPEKGMLEKLRDWIGR